MMARMMHSYITTVRDHESDSVTGSCVDQSPCVWGGSNVSNLTRRCLGETRGHHLT